MKIGNRSGRDAKNEISYDAISFQHDWLLERLH